jgi:hypothetical protein
MDLTDLAKKLRESKLINWGFCLNTWVWFHILAGALLFNTLRAFDVSVWLAVIITSGIAVVWELIEFFLENDGKWENVRENYGSVEKWKWDTIGDILGVILIVLICLI